MRRTDLPHTLAAATLAAVAAATCLAADADPAQAQLGSSPAPGWSGRIDPRLGTLAHLDVGGQEWLAAPASLSIFDEKASKEIPLSTEEVRDQGGGRFSCRLSGDGFSAQADYTLASSYLSAVFQVTNTGKADVGGAIRWTLPLNLSGKRLFVTDQVNHFAFDDVDVELKFSYPFMAFPMLTAYGERGGLSIIRDAAEKVTYQEFIVPRDGRVQVQAINLWLQPGKTARVTCFLVPHVGDWRPGLRWFRERYRDWLELKLAKATDHEGAVTTWRPVEDAHLADYATQGLKWWEVHGTYKHLGKYVAEKEPYYWALNDRLAVLRSKGKPGKDLKELGEPDQTHEQVRDFIRRLHKVGAHAYVYWNQNDCWTEFAQRFPDAIARKGDGEPFFDPNYLINLMAVDPPNSWTAHILSELRKIIETYPELDGIFNDQVCYYHYDYARRDGISMVNGSPVYNNRFAYLVFGEQVEKLLHDRGLVVWGNGVYSVDVARYFDGIMAEGTSKGLERSRYLGLMGKPVVMLGNPWRQAPAAHERVLKRCLVSGAQTNVVRDEWIRTEDGKKTRAQAVSLLQAYLPFFDLIRGKRWVLADHALQTPEGIEGNVFTSSRGQGIVPLVSWEKSAAGGSPEGYRYPVRVRFEENPYRAVYLASPERPGRYRLAPRISGGVYEIQVPIHRSASVLVFEREGVRLSLDAASLLAAPGKPHTVTAVLDNLSANPVRGTLSLAADDARAEKACAAAPGECARLEATLTLGAGDAGRSIPVKLSFVGAGLKLEEEALVLVRGPVALDVQAPETAADDETLKIGVRVANLGGLLIRDPVIIESNGREVARQSIHLRGAGAADVALTLPAPEAGAAMVARIGDARAPIGTQVLGTAFRGADDPANIVRAWLTVKANTSGGPHLLLNGVEVGQLPSYRPREALWQGMRVEIRPEHHGAIRAQNTLRLSNKAESLLRLKDFRLELLMADGTRVVSSLDARRVETSEKAPPGTVRLDFRVR